ncbi:MAG: DUF4241 domain-containing protein [Fluviicola sp.]|nr:DUF4241 domain-containing protein [Fluviicola sp.]
MKHQRTKTNMIFTFLFSTVFAFSVHSINKIQPSDSSTTRILPKDSIPTFPQIFETAFNDQTEVHQDTNNFIFTQLELGKIKINSGKIIACDPILMFNAIAFENKFPIGNFPVQLAMANNKSDYRVAFSRIVFSENPVVKWEFALLPGQKPIDLIDSSIYCYSVDAGTGIFIDANSNKLYDKFQENTWENVIINKMEKYNYTGYIHDFGNHNLAVFSTGYGDGCYATYIGYDSKGKICRLLTDFGLIRWWEDDLKSSK